MPDRWIAILLICTAVAIPMCWEPAAAVELSLSLVSKRPVPCTVDVLRDGVLFASTPVLFEAKKGVFWKRMAWTAPNQGRYSMRITYDGTHEETVVTRSAPERWQYFAQMRTGVLTFGSVRLNTPRTPALLASGASEKQPTLRVAGTIRGVGPVEATFGVPAAGNVRVSVFDAAGRLVERLIDEHMEAGRWTARWETSRGRPPVGVYLVRLEVDGMSVSKKLVLMP